MWTIGDPLFFAPGVNPTIPQKAVSHRPLVVPLPDMEGVLKDGVHDPPDAEGWLDHIGDNLLHCQHKDPVTTVTMVSTAATATTANTITMAR